jgi:hypothetical protein
MVILLFVYAVNFNIFNELLEYLPHAYNMDIFPNFVEILDSN